ncbi:unnamed protein product [Aspergillus oryzae]|uniref:Unnamed protein product n=1 Tax=Aspergillus oryzae TaxID=5062 RepID=A0AAN4YIM5_ASPOZ|nr:unnamed protein product [Aspergillus oryzae]
MRWIMDTANALGIFSPALTLGIFAIFRGLDYALDAGTVFTSVALLTMVTHPANMVMTIIPRAVASLANFRRIQEYLTEQQLLDERHGLPQKPKDVGDTDNDRTSAMVLEHVDICLSGESCPLLRDINLKQIAFCNQTPWLPNASIRDIICGGSRVIDYTWYQTVLDACCLSVDLETLEDPDGSQSCITNNGINLSGGQKSRIVGPFARWLSRSRRLRPISQALARAVYSRSRIVILDDPFSSLDGGVKKHIIGALLGPGGLFRRMQTTVFLITAEGTSSVSFGRISEQALTYEGTGTSDTQATAIKDHDDQTSDRFKVQADKMRMTDAADDLARRIGDIAVYRNNAPTFYKMTTNTTQDIISAQLSRFESSNIMKLDKSQGTMYLLLCLQRWLNVVLDLLITAIAVILIAFAITFRESATGGQVGVALNMIIAANTTLLRSVESWTSLETSLGSVARLKSVEEDTPVEKSSRDVLEPRLEWPTTGTIRIRSLSAAYNGKSTFILALLQLLDKQDGLIEVDNMDLARLPLRIVRQRCFVSIPQEPFILPSASIRFNLDPYGQHDSTAIWKTLIKTNLWSHFSSPVGQGMTMTVGRDALDKTLSDFPPLSTGQRQVFASAQALLRARTAISCYECSLDGRRPILLLDEPSASLDEVTASSMQQIMEEFTSRGHTVITITHGMNVLQNQGREGSDQVLRMEDGRLVQTSG